MKYFSKKIIFSSKLLENFKQLQTISNKNICAVLKANAYGHGSKQVCKILSQNCNFFAVQNLYEAIQIRKLNKYSTILVLGYCVNFKKAINNNISITIDNIEDLKSLTKLNQKAKIHLKINTGMNRLGIGSLKTFREILFFLEQNCDKIELEGIYTHFYDTKNKEVTQNQIKKFKQYLSKITPPKFVHVGGSGMLNYNIDFANYIRCGLSLYGYNCPFTKPVMQIVSKVKKITNIKQGEFVGYDSFFCAPHNMTVALIPLGYADGITRAFQNNMYILFKEQKLKVVGKICMDMFMVDVTNIKIKTESHVSVFFDATYWAKNSNLSEYEILTGLNQSRCDVVVQK